MQSVGAGLARFGRWYNVSLQMPTIHSTRLSILFADIGNGCIFPWKKNVFDAMSASLRTIFDHRDGGDVALLVLMLHCWWLCWWLCIVGCDKKSAPPENSRCTHGAQPSGGIVELQSSRITFLPDWSSLKMVDDPGSVKDWWGLIQEWYRPMSPTRIFEGGT